MVCVDAECQIFTASKVATCWVVVCVGAECQTFMVSKVATCWLWYVLMQRARHSWLVRWLYVEVECPDIHEASKVALCRGRVSRHP